MFLLRLPLPYIHFALANWWSPSPFALILLLLLLYIQISETFSDLTYRIIELNWQMKKSSCVQQIDIALEILEYQNEYERV